MLTMANIHDIRKLYFEQGKTVTGISQETGYDRKTVRKYVQMENFNVSRKIKPAESKICPKMEPYKPLVDQWLLEDKQRRKKQRHTAKRVYERLCKEAEGFNCSYRLVAEYVSGRKKEIWEKNPVGNGFLPIEHHPGEAQADFGYADFIENGERISGKYLVLSFPYSNAAFIQLIYEETPESLLESLRNIFEHIGGVPSEIWFDNTGTIVSSIIRGGDRKVIDRFRRFEEHYGFNAVFMNPNSGNEKGNVENKVGYLRRNYLVPEPAFENMEEFNKQLLLDAAKDFNREHYRYNETISSRYDKDKSALLPLPNDMFDTAQYEVIRTNKWGKFTLHGGLHTYSVSPNCAERDLCIRITDQRVEVLDENGRTIVSHKRLFGSRKQERMNWLPYLRAISGKPRSLRNSGIYDMMPPLLQEYMDHCANSERGRMLRTLADLTEKNGFESAVAAVTQAVHAGVNDPDSLESLHRILTSDVPVLPPLSASSDIPFIHRIPANLAQYDNLLIYSRGNDERK